MTALFGGFNGRRIGSYKDMWKFNSSKKIPYTYAEKGIVLVVRVGGMQIHRESVKDKS